MEVNKKNPKKEKVKRVVQDHYSQKELELYFYFQNFRTKQEEFNHYIKGRQ